MNIAELPGLGKKSEAMLNNVGIYDSEQLKKLGAIACYIKVISSDPSLANLNLLYALVGAIEQRSWLDVAKHDKERLLIELESYQEFNQLFNRP